MRAFLSVQSQKFEAKQRDRIEQYASSAEGAKEVLWSMIKKGEQVQLELGGGKTFLFLSASWGLPPTFSPSHLIPSLRLCVCMCVRVCIFGV